MNRINVVRERENETGAFSSLISAPVIIAQKPFLMMLPSPGEVAVASDSKEPPGQLGAHVPRPF